jgi:hypothetical protein
MAHTSAGAAVVSKSGHTPSSLDGQLARFTDELNAATTRRELNELFQENSEWISKLSLQGQQKVFAVMQDIASLLDE